MRRAQDRGMNERREPAHPVEIGAEAIAACPFSMAEEYAKDFLRDAEGHVHDDDVGARWLPRRLRPRVDLTFNVQTDVAERGRVHNELRLRWRRPSALLPDFRGVVRFRIAGSETAVIVTGQYTPPLGAFGRVVDTLAGTRIARSTLLDLASRIAAQLGARHADWVAQHPVIGRRIAQ
jgi:hypothetical protein